MKYTAYRTRQDNEDRYWSNDDGWCDLQDATLFSRSEVAHFDPPAGAVAIDDIELDGRRRKVVGTRKELPVGPDSVRRFLGRMRDLGIKAYEEQRLCCITLLEDRAGIQCSESEDLETLATAVISNVNDGTLDCHCLEHYCEE